MPNERIQRLREQATQALRDLPTHVPPPGQSGDTQALLESLRVYQVELELQNDNLLRAQQTAAVASERYQQLFDLLPMPALVLNANGQVREDNLLAREWLGPPKTGQLSDFRLTACMSKADRTRLLRAMARGSTHQVQQVEQVRITPIRNHGEPGSGPSGDVAGPLAPRVADAYCIKLPPSFHADPHFAVLLMDQAVELARQADRQLFQTLIDSSDDLIYATDRRGHIMLANQAMLDAMSQPADRVLGQLAKQLLGNPTSEGDAQQTLISLPTPGEGTPRTYASHQFNMHTPDGRTVGVGSIARDVSAEHAAHQMQQLSETVFMNAMEAIIVTDAQTGIQRANPAFEKMSGLRVDQVLGLPTRTLRSGRHDSAFYQAMWSDIREHGHWEGEITNRHAGPKGFYTVWTTIAALKDRQGNLSGYMAVQTDLTALHKAQSEVLRLASYDTLTGLPNRALFQDRIRQMIANAKRSNGTFAVLFADLDHFKEVNDTLGHLAGDELLKVIAQRLQQGLRDQDTVARMGGDEFVLLLPDAFREQGLAVAEQLQNALRQPVDLADAPGYQPRASVGVAVYPDDGDTADLLLRHADTAMYAAKVAGRNRAQIYTSAMGDEATQAFALQSELSHAIERGELRLHWQPKFRLSDLALVGAEALLRWERPVHGLCTPGHFLDLAEKSGLLPAMDEWVLDTALRQLAAWQQAGLWPDHAAVSVNQTAQDLRRPRWAARLQSLLHDRQVSARHLEIELTEGSLAQPNADIQANLEHLSALGVGLSIDDFGTGYSSLSYLKTLPVSTIKIDQSFVRDMLNDESDRVLVETMLAMAHKLGHGVVAEGVETEAQRALLLELHCCAGQGHLVSPALPCETFERRFLAHAHGPGASFHLASHCIPLAGELMEEDV